MKIVVIENPRPLTLEHYNDVANAPLSASLNSGYALAVARRAGWETAYLDFSAALLDVAAMAQLILDEGADIVLFHWVYSWGHEGLVCGVLELLRREGAAVLGAFGLFPTLSTGRLMQHAPQLDFIMAGEFELTLAELLASLRTKRTLAALPGLAVPGGVAAPRPLLEDLSRLPVPEDVGANCSYASLNIAASRGCYGECSFCFIHRYYGCSRRRVRDLASLERELEIRLARRAIDSLYFIDPTFIGQGGRERDRAVAISRLAQQYRLPFGFETRVDSVDADLLATLAAHGATSVFLGIESGCAAVLQRLGKRITKAQIHSAVRAVQASGIELNIGFIMFEPDATLAELEENYVFLDELGLLGNHELSANLLYHNQIVLHGSAAWQRFESEGRLLPAERLPFEASCSFSDERVGLVCAAMGRLTSAYFSAMDGIRRSGSAEVAGGGALNQLLKDAFRTLCRISRELPPQELGAVEAHYAAQLRDFFRTGAMTMLAEPNYGRES